MLGLLPMALSHGIGSETQRPLAVVIIGGLVSATLLTVIVLPTVYVVFESRKSEEVSTSRSGAKTIRESLTTGAPPPAPIVDPGGQ